MRFVPAVLLLCGSFALPPGARAVTANRISEQEVVIGTPLSNADMASIRALPSWPRVGVFIGDGAPPDVLSSLAKLPETRRVVVGSINSTLADLTPLARLPALAEFRCRGLWRGPDARLSLKPLAACTDLRVLEISEFKVVDCDALAACEKLWKISFRDCGVDSLAFLERTPDVATLDLGGHGHTFSSYGPILSLKHLRGLDLSKNPQATDESLAALRPLEGLDSFQMTGAPTVTTFSFLEGCRKLRELDVSGCVKLASFDVLKSLPDLRSLNISSTAVRDLAPLAGLARLERLGASYTQLRELGPLAGLTELNSLDISYSAVSDLAPLKNLTALSGLDLSRTKVTDLAPLAGLERLEGLRIDKTEIRDLKPLLRLNSLRTLVLSPSVPAEEIAALTKAQPLLKITVSGK